MRKTSSILISLLLTATVSLPALAAWKLDNANSELSFISVKKANIAENHNFAKLAGNINEQAQVNISVDLTSVNTNIAIRDDRMKNCLESLVRDHLLAIGGRNGCRYILLLRRRVSS